MRLLVVEDDEILQDGLVEGLKLDGFEVDLVGTCEAADAAVLASSHDAIILDIGLPDGSGLELLKQWRKRGVELPILLLTARNLIDERISGLDSGADDYLGKPFALAELSARLRALLRRSHGRAEAGIEVGSLFIDEAGKQARLDGVLVPLSRREFAILQTLAGHPGQVFSRHELEDRIYGWQEEVESNAVEVHIHHLRLKLGRKWVETVRGQGYRIAIP
ncbi:winged helix-turn-helix domain-containing protein [Henriciella sp.]|uniref:winged helix-turn-helix domain-containing protein n=1 Tax=Henriciella sp. TaxID=1968823 RepID=UPI00345C54C6